MHAKLRTAVCTSPLKKKHALWRELTIHSAVHVMQKPRRQITVFAVSDDGRVAMGDAKGKSLNNSVEHKHLPTCVTNTKLLSGVVWCLLFLRRFVVFDELKNKWIKPCHRRMQSLTHAHASPADFTFVKNRLIAFAVAFHDSKILHSGESWVPLSKSVKSEKDFEGAMTLVELLGLEKEDLVGRHGRLFKKSMERMHACFQARLFDQCWFVTIRDDENDEFDGLVPTQRNVFSQDASTAPLKRAFAGIKNKTTQDVPRHVPAAATSPDPVAETADVPAPDAVSTPVAAFRRHSIFTPDKAPILRELAKKGHSVTVPSLNNQDRKFFCIPKCTTAKSAASSLKKNGLLKEIATTLGSGLTSPEGHGMGPFFLADAVAKQDIGAFEAAAKNDGINFHQPMSAVKTSATWVDARLTKASQRPVTDHLAAQFNGKQATANEKEVDKVGSENQKTTRVFDTCSFTARVGKKSWAEDVTAQARDVTVSHSTSCPHEVAQTELMARASSGKKVEGMELPLADQSCVATSFLADRDDGQGKVTPVAHLLAKDECALLKELGIAAVLDK
jgi:hypothetical protein